MNRGWIKFDPGKPPFDPKFVVDIWAKRWDHRTGLFSGQRMPGAFYERRGIITPVIPNPEIVWCGVIDGWRPTHYMLIPDPPKDE